MAEHDAVHKWPSVSHDNVIRKRAVVVLRSLLRLYLCPQITVSFIRTSPVRGIVSEDVKLSLQFFDKAESMTSKTTLEAIFLCSIVCIIANVGVSFGQSATSSSKRYSGSS